VRNARRLTDRRKIRYGGANAAAQENRAIFEIPEILGKLLGQAPYSGRPAAEPSPISQVKV